MRLVIVQFAVMVCRFIVSGKTGDITNMAIAVLGMAVLLTALGAVYYRRNKAKAE